MVNKTLRIPGSSHQRGFSLFEMVMVMAVMGGLLTIAGGLIQGFYNAHRLGRPQMEEINDASAALDRLVQIIRVAGNNTTLQPIDPGSPTNGTYRSIHIQADWNPVNGALSDPFENITFTTSNGKLFKQEPSDSSPIALYDNIESLSFTYYDKTNVLLADPVNNANQIALVKIQLLSRREGTPGRTFSAVVRLRQVK